MNGLFSFGSHKAENGTIRWEVDGRGNISVVRLGDWTVLTGNKSFTQGGDLSKAKKKNSKDFIFGRS